MGWFVDVPIGLEEGFGGVFHVAGEEFAVGVHHEGEGER
jgi:hypothetical protein